MTKAEQWIQSLTAARQELLTFLQSLTQAQWQQPVFSEGTPWTVTTVVSHLIDAERGMSIQVHRARNGEPTVPEGFDINRWNAGVQERIGALSPEELLSRLETTRAKTLEVLNSLGEQEWSMTGRHPLRGVITIEQYYETIAAHDRVHLEDIKKGLAT